jgi:hypothetical protein
MLKPILLMALIQTESGWNPNARSHAGAVGLGQMTPIAVREVQNVYNIDIEPDLTNPCENVVWSVLYLSYAAQHARTTQELLIMYHGGFAQLALYRQRLPIAEETDQYWRRIIKLKRDYDRTFARIPEPPTAREQWVTGILTGLQPGGGETYLDLAGVRLGASEAATRALSVCRSVGGPPPATAVSGHSNHLGI